jgi:L-threonylcarbamoyladenylate synthase
MKLEEEIKKSVELLKKGKIILYPTDTIWGIGCDATNVNAVERIYKLKGRNEDKGLIVLIDNVDKLETYLEKVPPIAYDLISHSKSPLTIVYPGAKNLAKNIIAKDGTIAIRVVHGKYSGATIKQFGKPIASTSANFSDQPTAKTFDHVEDGIKNGVDYVVTAFRNTVHSAKASTIIKVEGDGSFSVIRP